MNQNNNSIQNILLTGGAGYIGSQICFELMKQPEKYQPIIIDNLSNSTRQSIDSISKFYNQPIHFYPIDIRNKSKLHGVFKLHSIDAVIHLAGLKSVKESIENPVEYYCNNVRGSRNLLECMHDAKVNHLIFSSSACVYGDPEILPLTEESMVKPINPYGQSKLIVENLLQQNSNRKDWQQANFISLRYFNPIGADPSTIIGENPNKIPENLIPYLMKVASHQLDILHIYGNDYPTPDGTAIRDYLHIVDLAQAHLSTLEYLMENTEQKYDVINLGTGKGYSVLDVITAFSKIGVTINYQIDQRRLGDAAEVYADPSKALHLLKWKAKLGLTEMVQDAWNWWQKNLRQKRSRE